MDWRSLFSFGRGAERRASAGGTRTQSADDFLTWLLGPMATSAADVVVTIDVALGVPAVWAAVNFLSGTLAGLPIKLYRKTSAGREEVSGALANLLHYAPNSECSSFEWRKLFFDCVFTTGRGLAWIERSSSGTPIGIWHIEPEKVTIERSNGRKLYRYNGVDGRKVYPAEDVIDVPFMLQSDGLRHRGPIQANRDAIGLAVAATQYGSKFLANGGVPPFVVSGKFMSPQAMGRASDDLAAAVRNSAREKRQALVLPEGLELKPIGADPEKAQMVELQRFCIEQIARVYSLPPVFLQDLTHGTFANTEQQDLHLTKHTIIRWVKHFEQELNLKIFGARSNSRYFEMIIDGILRGDFKTRIEGYAKGIQHGIYTPAYVHALENLPTLPGSDRLFMQGAMMPMDMAGQASGQPSRQEPAADDA